MWTQNGATFVCILWAAFELWPWTTATTASGRHMRLIHLLSMEPSLASSLRFTGAALHTAAQLANVNYARLNMSISVQAIPQLLPMDCAQLGASSADFLAGLYYRNIEPELNKQSTCNAVLYTSCNGIMAIGSLAREWDWPAFYNGISLEDDVDELNYPSAVALGGTYGGLASALLGVLQFHNWTHVSLLLDQSSGMLIYKFQTDAINKILNASVFNLQVVHFSINDTGSIAKALDTTKQRSRVLLLMMTTRKIIKIMETASYLGMDNGEYIVETDVYGRRSDFHNPPRERLNLTRSLLFLTLQPPRQRYGSERLNAQIADRAQWEFNLTYSGTEKPLDSFLAQVSYNVIDVLMALMQSAPPNYMDTVGQSTGAQWCSGRRLAHAAASRKFVTSVDTLHIDAKRIRHLNVDIYAFSMDSRRMQLYGSYDSTRKQMTLNNNFTSIPWPLGHPPADVPWCGFFGEDSRCLYSGSLGHGNVEIIASVMACLGFLICGLVGLVVRNTRKNWERGNAWWLLAEEELPAWHELLAGPGAPVSVSALGAASRLHWRAQSRNGQAVLWRGTTVWIRWVRVGHSVHLSSRTMNNIFPSQFSHANVCALIGICFQAGNILFVSQYCPRGSLQDMLDQLTSLDVTFKVALIGDLIEGLAYLHARAGPHGHLRPTCCLIDGRLTLKIGKYGFTQLIEQLSEFEARPLQDPGPSIWDPPEQARQHAYHVPVTSSQRSYAGDVYTLAMLMASLICGCIPSAVDGRFLNEIDCFPRLQQVITSCSDRIPGLRPTMKRVHSVFRSMCKEQGMVTSAAEEIMLKLHKYAHLMEVTANERTKELEAEKRRCDEILQQMLPPFVVGKLRNGDLLHAEWYESVSVCFCQLHGFADWTASVSPNIVMQMLRMGHAVFDNVVTMFRVQKIETVNDCNLVVSGIPVDEGFDHTVEMCKMVAAHQRLLDAEYSPHCANCVLYESGESTSCTSLPCLRSASLLWGIHCGTCAAGVVGTKIPRYCLFGDTINVASRMMTQGAAGRVQVSEAVAQRLLPFNEIVCQERGIIPIKGRGPMRTFWLKTNNK